MSVVQLSKVAEFRIAVQAKMQEAVDLFNLNFDAEAVKITFNVRGGVSGRATRRGNRYFLDFNREAIEKYFDDMVTETIPHEVAHIVCFARPELGKGHDAGWTRVTRRLGGAAARTHNYDLSPGKVIRRFVYIISAQDVITIGPKHHKAIQTGARVFQSAKTRERIQPHHFSHVVDHNNNIIHLEPFATAASAPAPRHKAPVSSTGTKMERATSIYLNNQDLSRKDVIALFVAQLEMTPAGASTYYQTIKKRHS